MDVHQESEAIGYIDALSRVLAFIYSARKIAEGRVRKADDPTFSPDAARAMLASSLRELEGIEHHIRAQIAAKTEELNRVAEDVKRGTPEQEGER